jgi:2-polyprenyl-3-methyl-5-hydroxy-6-metoxy-1,4-benzoquinol methylase
MKNSEKDRSMSASQFHSNIAQDFDALYQNSPAFQERYQVWIQLLDLHVSAKARMLDLGCGSGIFSIYIAQKGNAVTGIDGAANMIQLCQQRQSKLGIHHCTFQQLEMPFEQPEQLGQPFDALISSSVLEYIPDLDLMLAQINQCLAPNGTLILSFPNSKSIYRKFERWCYILTRKPAYYQYVHHVITPEALAQKLEKYNILPISTQYYASAGFVMRMLRLVFPKHRSSNLFVTVFRKNINP